MNHITSERDLTPRQRLMLYECERGVCPRCGTERGLSVPDDCTNPNCPDWWDIEQSLWPPETLR